MLAGTLLKVKVPEHEFIVLLFVPCVAPERTAGPEISGALYRQGSVAFLGKFSRNVNRHRAGNRKGVTPVRPAAGRRFHLLSRSFLMRNHVFTLTCLLLLLTLTATGRGQTMRIVASEAGALGDGTTLNTEKIQSAIDQIATKGGGTLVIPKGVFLSGAIFLKPGVNLHLEKDAVLRCSTDMKNFPEHAPASKDTSRSISIRP